MTIDRTPAAIWPQNPFLKEILHRLEKQQYLSIMCGGFRANKTYSRVLLLWVEYYYLTETFDRTLPGRQGDRGEWIPFDLKLSNEHASGLRKKVNVFTAGICNETSRSARLEARDISFPRLKEIYNRLGTYYLSGGNTNGKMGT